MSGKEIGPTMPNWTDPDLPRGAFGIALHDASEDEMVQVDVTGPLWTPDPLHVRADWLLRGLARDYMLEAGKARARGDNLAANCYYEWAARVMTLASDAPIVRED